LDALPKTVVVVPCFNEAHRIDREAFLEAVAAKPWLHLFFVDDGSTDSTGDALDALCEVRPERLQALHLSRNAGKAEAVRRGVLAAFDSGASVSGYWDADLATPLDEVAPMVELLLRRDALMVLGARVLMLGRRVERHAARHYLGRVFATAVSLLLRLPVYDTQCGAKVFRCEPLMRDVFSSPFLTRWVFDVEILARVLATDPSSRTRLIEHPLEEWRDVEGSRLTRADWLRVVLELGRVARRYRPGL
jgi:glycosyltransferase involved in cell wall biosynthesis